MLAISQHLQTINYRVDVDVYIYIYIYTLYSYINQSSHDLVCLVIYMKTRNPSSSQSISMVHHCFLKKLRSPLSSRGSALIKKPILIPTSLRRTHRAYVESQSQNPTGPVFFHQPAKLWHQQTTKASWKENVWIFPSGKIMKQQYLQNDQNLHKTHIKHLEAVK